MRLHELEGLLHGRLSLQERADRAQAVGSVRSGDFTGFIELQCGVLFGQAQEPLQHAHAFDTACGDDRLGPAGGVSADTFALGKHPGRTALHRADLCGDKVLGVGAETPGFDTQVKGNLLQAVVKDPHHPAIPTRPHAPAQIFRRG
jgi:hypothetical protein